MMIIGVSVTDLRRNKKKNPESILVVLVGRMRRKPIEVRTQKREPDDPIT